MVSELTQLINRLAMLLPPVQESVNKSGYKGRNQSIHPRVVNGVTKYEKVNTCFSPNPATKERKILGLMAHLERHPHDLVSVGHLAKLEA